MFKQPFVKVGDDWFADCFGIKIPLDADLFDKAVAPYLDLRFSSGGIERYRQRRTIDIPDFDSIELDIYITRVDKRIVRVSLRGTVDANPIVEDMKSFNLELVDHENEFNRRFMKYINGTN